MPLPTVSSTLAVRHEVWATCAACSRSRPLDLAALQAAGWGSTALVDLPLRCQCGSRRVGITVSGGGYGYPSQTS